MKLLNTLLDEQLRFIQEIRAQLLNNEEGDVPIRKFDFEKILKIFFSR